MWDQRLKYVVFTNPPRIIPTYVGSTSSAGYDEGRDSNHSHVCGINRTSCTSRTVGNESFPRMWDQPAALHFVVRQERIIPTYVGSTLICLLFSVHALESFPRMWDQPLSDSAENYTYRIIPTYVGSTFRHSPRWKQSPNHSHVCGINPTNSFYLASGNTASCSFVLLENGL